MPVSILTLIDGNEKESLIYYNHDENRFYSDKGESLTNHTYIEESAPYVIRVFTGKGCNAECKYCLQYKHRKDIKDNMPIKDLVSEINRFTKGHPIERIHIWGGEPLLYFNKFKEYVENFKKIMPGQKILTSTNGILLRNKDIQNYLYENIFRLQISWDGLGQHIRGEDPLKDKSILDFIHKMRNKDPHSIIFAPVMGKHNRCLKTYRNMVKYICGDDDFIIGASRLVLPLDDAMAEYSITDEKELDEYAINLRNNIILDGGIPQWDLLNIYASHMYSSLGSAISPSYCPSESGYFLIIDQAGNLLNCSNNYADSTDEYGNSYSLGHVSKLENGARPVAKFIHLDEKRKDKCSKCIIYSLCQGGCPRIPSNLVDTYCNIKMAELLPVYIAVLHAMTGKILIRVKTLN